MTKKMKSLLMHVYIKLNSEGHNIGHLFWCYHAILHAQIDKLTNWYSLTGVTKWRCQGVEIMAKKGVVLAERSMYWELMTVVCGCEHGDDVGGVGLGQRIALIKSQEWMNGMKGVEEVQNKLYVQQLSLFLF
jgi:hypothetical protein